MGDERMITPGTERLFSLDRMRIPPTRDALTCGLCDQWIDLPGLVATIEGDGHHGHYAHADCARAWAGQGQ